MDFQEFCKKKERLCVQYSRCKLVCPFANKSESCDKWCNSHPEEAESILQIYANQKPLTNRDVWYSVFGDTGDVNTSIEWLDKEYVPPFEFIRNFAKEDEEVYEYTDHELSSQEITDMLTDLGS